MSPKKMIGLSLRPQAQTLRGPLTVWPPLNMSGVFLRGGMKKQPGRYLPDCSIPWGGGPLRFSPLLHKRSTQQHWHLAGDPAVGIQTAAG